MLYEFIFSFYSYILCFCLQCNNNNNNNKEGYSLSKPISTKITHLLYIDDMKLFAAPENKLKRVMTVAKNGMESTGLKWN